MAQIPETPGIVQLSCIHDVSSMAGCCDHSVMKAQFEVQDTITIIGRISNCKGDIETILIYPMDTLVVFDGSPLEYFTNSCPNYYELNDTIRINNRGHLIHSNQQGVSIYQTYFDVKELEMGTYYLRGEPYRFRYVIFRDYSQPILNDTIINE